MTQEQGKLARLLNKAVDYAEKRTPEDILKSDIVARQSQLSPTLSRSSELWVSRVGIVASFTLVLLVLLGPVFGNKIRTPGVVITDVSANTKPEVFNPRQNNEQLTARSSTTIDLPRPIVKFRVKTEQGIMGRFSADRDTLANRIPTFAPGDQQQYKSWNARETINEKVNQVEEVIEGNRRLIFARIPTHDGGVQYYAWYDSADIEDNQGIYVLTEDEARNLMTPTQLVAAASTK